MTTATPNYTARTLIAAGTACVPGTPQRQTLDLRGKFGGMLTYKMTNGGTGPTIQCTASVLIAHDDSTTPAAGAAGAVWKTLVPAVGNGTAANTVGEWSQQIQGVQHLEIEFANNTAQNVTVEAYFTEFSNVTSV